MAKWCRIDNDNFVIETTTTDPAGRFSPPIVFEACPDATEQGWIKDGTNFRPATADDTMTLAEAVAAKYSEADVYGQSLINAAYANPTQGANVDGELQKRIVGSRQKDRADKVAGEITLTQEEKDIAKTDQKLSEYETKVNDAIDKARAEIDKKDTAAEVMALDIPTITTWPVWSPPV